MGIRRRRRRLSNLMGRLDQRVRSVELRPINLLTSGEISSAVEIGAPAQGPETVVSASAPWQFRKVQDAYVYPKGVTGLSTDRVEIYLESDLGAAVDDRIEVSGIHWASSEPIDVDSDNFTVLATASPPWDDRASYMHDPTQDQLSGVTISNSYYFKPETAAPTSWTSRRRLQTRRKVDSYEISAAPGSTVTLTMNAVHHFEVGDIVNVGIFSENSTAYGVDGLFEISAVSSTTIEYVLAAGVDTAVPSTDVSSADVYVFPVAREWAQDGSIWVDSANNETYYWDGIRWVDYTPGAVPGDGDPPSPPTSLTATAEMNYSNGGTTGVIQVTLSWTAPTTTEAGAELTDLAAYKIKYREGVSGEWIPWPTIGDPTISSYTFGTVGTFKKETTYYFQLVASDSGGEDSTAATANVLTPAKADTNLEDVRPADLTADPPYLGTVTLYWQGSVENSIGGSEDNPDGLYYVEIHRSTSSTFTASDSTRIGTVVAVPNAKFVDGSLSEAYGTTFYYRAVIVDGNGTKSLQSDPPLAVTAQSNVDVSVIQGIIDAANIVPGTIVTGEDIIGINITGDLIRGNTINANLIEANSITSDQIDVGNITAQIVDSRLFTSRTVTGTNPPAYTGAGITFDDTGLYAYDIDSLPTFQLDAETGTVTIGNYVQSGDLSNYVTNSGLSTTLSSYATLSALGLYITASDASSTYLTQISAGNLYISQSDDAGDYVTSISGDKITTGTINADRIGAGTFTGSTFRTSAPNNKRILISGSSNTIKTYESGDGDLSPRGIIEGTTNGLELSGRGGAQWYIGTNLAEYYGGDSTRPNLLLGSTGALFYGYHPSGTSSKAFLGLTASQATFRGPGGTSAPAVYATSTNLRFDTGTSGYDFIDDYTVRMETLASTAGVGNVGTLSDGTLYRGTSDSRLKTNVEPLAIGLNFVNSLRPVTFNWNTERIADTSIKNFGLIAQEVDDTLQSSGVSEKNNLVNRYRNSTTFPDFSEDEQIYTVDYASMVPMLVKSIQELSNKVDALEGRIQELENR